MCCILKKSILIVALKIHELYIYLECNQSHASNLIGSLHESIQVVSCSAAFRSRVNRAHFAKL